MASDTLGLRKFVSPEFIFGAGGRRLAGRYAKNLGARKVLVVTDPGVMSAGWTQQVMESLEAEGIACICFSQVTENPKAEEVMAGAQAYQSEDCNVIVAVGGGSPMDCAKGIGIVSSNKNNILSFEGIDEVLVPGPPLICVPTTAGSSADLSQFAIITDMQRRVKIAIISKTVVPDVSLIDPETTTTMDSRLTAATGMDALVHAIEAYVSNAHFPITDLHALEAIRLVTAHLVSVIKQPDDLQIRSRMMLASLYAGLAFSNASLGAVHALAHSLGGFLDFAHGEANAILLPHVINVNFDAAADRYVQIGKAMGLPAGDAKSALIEGITRLQREAGITKRLGEMGLARNNIPVLSEKAMHDACIVTNPRHLTRQEIEGIYEKAL